MQILFVMSAGGKCGFSAPSESLFSFWASTQFTKQVHQRELLQSNEELSFPTKILQAQINQFHQDLSSVSAFGSFKAKMKFTPRNLIFEKFNSCKADKDILAMWKVWDTSLETSDLPWRLNEEHTKVFGVLDNTFGEKGVCI